MDIAMFVAGAAVLCIVVACVVLCRRIPGVASRLMLAAVLVMIVGGIGIPLLPPSPALDWWVLRNQVVAIAFLAAAASLLVVAGRAAPAPPAERLRLQRGVRFALLLLLALTGTGVFSGLVSREDCIAEAREHMRATGVRGVSGFSEEPYDHLSIEVQARVAMPFVVVVDYYVPWSMHAAVHERTYVALFGYVILVGEDVVYLV